MKLPEYYKIDYKRLIELLNPVIVRTHLFLILVWSCISPIIKFYVNMRSAIESFFLYHRYNATVLSLEELLNSSFDPEQKRIRLKGYDLITSNIIRSEEENTDDHFILFVDQQEQNTRSSHLFTDGEQDNLHIFKLQIPADLENNKDTIQKMLVHYVPIGITFITEIN